MRAYDARGLAGCPSVHGLGRSAAPHFETTQATRNPIEAASTPRKKYQNSGSTLWLVGRP